MSAQRVIALPGAIVRYPLLFPRPPTPPFSALIKRPQARLWHTSTPFRIRSHLSHLRSPRIIRRNASNKPTPDITSQLGSPEPQPGLQARLKKLFKQYGYLSVGVYFALSAADLPLCFLAVQLAGAERIGQIEHQILSTLKSWTAPVWHIIEPVAGPLVHSIDDVITNVRRGAVNTAGMGPSEVPVQQDIKKSDTASFWTQLALAYGIHKTLLIFVRVPLTAVLTPKVARVLQSWGWRTGAKTAS